MILGIICAISAYSQVGFGAHQKWMGFVPDRETAVQVAAPLLKRALGANYWSECEPLSPERVQSIKGRWVITTRAKSTKMSGEDPNFESYLLAIDPWSSRVVIFGREANINASEILEQQKPDNLRKF